MKIFKFFRGQKKLAEEASAKASKQLNEEKNIIKSENFGATTFTTMTLSIITLNAVCR